MAIGLPELSRLPELSARRGYDKNHGHRVVSGRQFRVFLIPPSVGAAYSTADDCSPNQFGQIVVAGVISRLDD